MVTAKVNLALPPVMFFHGNRLLGRTGNLFVPRPGEVVNLEDPFTTSRRRFKVTKQKRVFHDNQHGSLNPGDVELSLTEIGPAGGFPTPPRTAVSADLICNGQYLGKTSMSLEPVAGGECDVDTPDGIIDYQVLLVERWFSCVSATRDGSSFVYDLAGTTVYLGYLYGS